MSSPKTAPTVVVVDPFSTGADLAAAFAARGWRSVAVISTPHLPDLYAARLRREEFADVVVHDGDVNRTVCLLTAHAPRAVIAGTEIGVETADLVAERLGLPGNGTALSRARRDKVTMADTVRRTGLAAPATLRCSEAKQAVAWAEARKQWPVVVKPVDSAGADGVTLCATAGAVTAAFARLQGSVNRLGFHNSALVVQELLTGQQYFVNTVSRAGRHHVAEIWRDTRARVPGAGLVCDREDLLPARGYLQDRIAAYVGAVLDALNIRWGPAHTELMLTADGPVLIEAAGRMQGTILHEAVIEATGQSHVVLTVEAVTDPVRFDARIESGGYTLFRHVSVVSLIAPHDGVIGPPEVVGQLHGVPSVFDVLGTVTPGLVVKRTVDLFTSPGFLYLVADSEDEIERDYKRIRRLETSGLYAPR